MRADITEREDIEKLVDTFYRKVEADKEIGFFFTTVAKVDWQAHLPKMYDFWESILFGTSRYKGNPMLAHFPINRKHPLEKRHFERWLSLWKQSLNELFEGEVATQAAKKAQNISALMSYKMDADRSSN